MRNVGPKGFKSFCSQQMFKIIMFLKMLALRTCLKITGGKSNKKLPNKN